MEDLFDGDFPSIPRISMNDGESKKNLDLNTKVSVKKSLRQKSKSPKRDFKKNPLKNLKGIQEMFPELTEQILKAINEEKMRERRSNSDLYERTFSRGKI